MPGLKAWVRRGLGALVALALRASSRPYVLTAGGILVVAPHPDDESLGCGGLIAAKAGAGHDVQVAFLTDGAASHPLHPLVGPEALARRRRAEAADAISVLGLKPDQAHFLDAPDGTLDRLDPNQIAALTARLSDLVRQFRPTETFVTYRHDGSTEHAAAFRLTAAALRAAGGGRLLEYPVWAWWNPLRLTGRLRPGDGNLRLALGPLRPIKRRAVECHRTQVEPLPPWGEPVLPRSILRACCGPAEFFFASEIES
jgi:LmbE family N-acetylglucosaminyl deacetylase